MADGTVGMIGLGRMGGRMAHNLLRAGFAVIGCDPRRPDDFAAAGGQWAASPREVAARATLIFQSLPHDEAFRDVVCGSDGLLARCGETHVVADLSTYPLRLKEEMAALLLARGTILLDCEITGTPEMLAQRDATIFVSGDPAAAARCAVAFEAIAERRLDLGAFGAASRMKLANNLLVGLHVAAAAEAMAFAERSGIPAAAAIAAIGSGAAASRMFTQRAPLMAERRYLPASGTLAGYLRYVDLITAEAARLDCATPLFEAAARRFRQAQEHAPAEADIAYVFEAGRGAR